MKRLVILVCGIMYSVFGITQTVTLEDATETAYKYVEKSTIFANSQRSKSTNVLPATTSTTKKISIIGEIPLYVVQLEEGWVLVASDSAATPILAASPVGTFPTIDEMPDAMKWLLSDYESSIKYAQDSIESRTISSKWESLSTLTGVIASNYADNQSEMLPDSFGMTRLDSVFWNQSHNNEEYPFYCPTYYNKFCPDWYSSLDCNRAHVGCVAVAMGMVMWYYRWPYYAEIPDNVEPTEEYSDDKHLVVYDWDRMVPAIYHTTAIENIDAVAGLLRDCGYASKMEYLETGSGTSLNNAKNALNGTFQFDNVQHKKRNLYIGNWVNLMKSEIVSGRPVIYGGRSPDGGAHSMVLWGYNDDKFRINWGWGGESNGGFYSLDALDPNESIYNGPYTKRHEALIGIEPTPICGNVYVSNNQSADRYCEVSGGVLTVSNYVVEQNQEGYFYSNERIRLTAGFHAKSGSKVRIAIMPIPCDENETRISSPQRIAPRTSATTDTSNDFENIESDMIQSTAIYTISGQLLQTVEGGQRDAAHLPNGIYILQHHMSDGSMRSEKIANNK